MKLKTKTMFYRAIALLLVFMFGLNTIQPLTVFANTSISDNTVSNNSVIESTVTEHLDTSTISVDADVKNTNVETQSEDETNAQQTNTSWSGRSNVINHNGCTYLLTDDGHFFKSSYKYGNTSYYEGMYDTSNHTIYNQSLSGGKWFEPLRGIEIVENYQFIYDMNEESYYNAWILIDADGNVYNFDKKLNFTKDDIETISTISSKCYIKLKDGTYFYDGSIKSSAPSLNTNKIYMYYNPNDTSKYVSITLQHTGNTVNAVTSWGANYGSYTFSKNIVAIKSLSKSSTIPNVAVIKVLYDDNTCEYYNYTLTYSGSFVSTFEKLNTSEYHDGTYLNSDYRQQYYYENGALYSTSNNQKISNDEYLFISKKTSGMATVYLEVDYDGNIYKGFGTYSSKEQETNHLPVANLTHICTYDSANVSFTEEDLANKTNKTFTCSCGKEYNISAEDFDSISLETKYVKYKDATCITGDEYGLYSTISNKVVSKYEANNKLGHNFDKNNKLNVVPVTCTTYGTYDCACTRCDYVETFTDESIIPEHKYDTSTKVNVSESTCLDYGVYHYKCTECGYLKSYIDKNDPPGHVYDDSTERIVNEGCGVNKYTYTYKTCTKCNKEIEVSKVANYTSCSPEYNYSAEHLYVYDEETGEYHHPDAEWSREYEQWIVPWQKMTWIDELSTYIEPGAIDIAWHTEDATCTKDGIKYKNCKYCGKMIESTKTETKATGHNYIITDGTASCTKGGTATLECKNCGFKSTHADIEALGHDYEMVVTKEATCTEDGLATFTCIRCNDSYTEKIDANHKYEITTHDNKTYDATCTEDGKITYECKYCQDSYEEVITALGHLYNAEVITEATSSQNGLIRYTCSVCNDTYDRTILQKSPVIAEAGGSSVVIMNTDTGYTSFTGPGSKFINGNEFIPYHYTINDMYDKRQVNLIVNKDGYGQYHLGNKDLYYGTPANIGNYISNSLNTIANSTNPTFDTYDSGEAQMTRNHESTMSYDGSTLKLWNPSYTSTSESNVYTEGYEVPIYEDGISEPIPNVKQISRSAFANLVLLEDGTVYANCLIDRLTDVDNFYNGKPQDGSYETIWDPNTTGKKVIKMVAVNHSVAFLLEDNTVSVVNMYYSRHKYNDFHGRYDKNIDYTPKFVSTNLYNYIDIAATNDYVYGLSLDGRIHKISTTADYGSRVLLIESDSISDTRFVSISGGLDHCLLLDDEANIWTFGNNTYGQLGNNTLTSSTLPIKITNGQYFTHISAGNGFSAAVDKDGNVYVWGHNNIAQCGLISESNEVYNEIKQPTLLGNFIHQHYYNKNNYDISDSFDSSCGKENTITRQCVSCSEVETIKTSAPDHEYISPSGFNFAWYLDFHKDTLDTPIIKTANNTIYSQEQDMYFLKINGATKTILVGLHPNVKNITASSGFSGVPQPTALPLKIVNVDNTESLSSDLAAVDCTGTVSYDFYNQFYNHIWYTSYDITDEIISSNCDYEITIETDNIEDGFTKFYEEMKAKYLVKSCSGDYEAVKYCKYCYDKQYEIKSASSHTISTSGIRNEKPGYIIYRCASCNEIIKETPIHYIVKISTPYESGSRRAVYPYANFESFSESVTYEEELILPTTGNNSGTFTIDLGAFETENGEHTISGNNILSSISNYKPGDTVKNLSTVQNYTIELIANYKTEIEFPKTVSYKDSKYFVTQWYISPAKHVGGIINPSTYSGSSIYAYYPSNINTLIPPNTTFYAYPLTYQCISGDDVYNEDLQKHAREDLSTEDKKCQNLDGILYNSVAEFKNEFPNVDMNFSYLYNKYVNEFILYRQNETTIYTPDLGYPILKGDKQVNGLNVYVLQNIRDYIPNYREYAISCIERGNTNSSSDSYRAYIYLNKFNTNATFVLNDTLNNTITTTHNVSDIPRYIYNDDRTKVLSTWTLDEEGLIDFYKNTKYYSGEYQLYSKWISVKNSNNNISLDNLKIINIDDFNENSEYLPTDVLLIENEPMEELYRIFSDDTYKKLNVSLNTDNKDLTKLFKKYLNAKKQVNGLSYSDKLLVYLNNGLNSTLYYNSSFNDTKSTIKITNHDIVETENTTMFTLNNESVVGKVVYDKTDSKLKVLYNNKLYIPNYIYNSRSTIDAIRNNLITTYSLDIISTGYCYINADNELKEIYYNSTIDSFENIDGTTLKEQSYCYKIGDIYTIHSKSADFIDLHVNEWNNQLDSNLYVSVDNEHLFAKGDNNYYTISNYTNDTISNAYNTFIEKYIVDLVDISDYSEALLLHKIANNEDISSLLTGNGFTLIKFPTEKEVKAKNFYVEKYILSDKKNILNYQYNIELTPNIIYLDVDSKESYEFLDTQISAEALKEPEESQWRLKYNKDSTDNADYLNFIYESDSGYDTSKPYSDEYQYYNLVNGDIDPKLNQSINIKLEVASLHDFNEDDLEFNIVNKNGDIKTTLNTAGGITVNEVDGYKLLNGEHVAELARIGKDTYHQSWWVLTEEGHIWYSANTNTTYTYRPEMDMYTQNSYTSGVSWGTTRFLQLAPQVKFKDFLGVDRAIYAIDVDGNLWTSATLQWDEGQEAGIYGLCKISKNVEFDKFGVIGSHSSYGIALLDTDGNIWVVYDNTQSDSIAFKSLGRQYYETNVDIYGNQYNRPSYIDVLQITEGIKYVDIAISYRSGMGISAIDENGDLWHGGQISNLLGYYNNSVKQYKGIDTPYHYNCEELHIMRKVTELYPGQYDGIKWRSLESRAGTGSSEFDVSTSYIAYIDTENRLWECFDNSVGYEITETNCLDGAGLYVIDTNGKLHLRRYNEKNELSKTTNIIYPEYTFKEVGTLDHRYYLTTDNEYIFDGLSYYYNDQSYSGNYKIDSVEKDDTDTSSQFTAMFKEYYKNIGSFSYSGYNKYLRNIGLNSYYQFTLPDIKPDGIAVIKKGEPLLYCKTYDIVIDSNDLAYIDGISLIEGDKILVNAYPDKQTITKVTDATISSYGYVDKYITDKNETEITTKSETVVTKNKLTIPRVTMDMDGAVYGLRSTYAEDEDKYYSDTVELDVIPLESLTATYTGPDIGIGDYADTNYIDLELEFENGHTETITYSQLTDAPDELYIDSVGANTFSMRFETKSDTVEINGINKIETIMASYPESVFKNDNFDPSKVIVDAIWSDGNITHPVVDESNFNSLKVTSIGDNIFNITVDGVSGKLNVHGYYYDRLEANYTGKDVKIDNPYYKDDVDVKVYYTENSFNKEFDELNKNDWISYKSSTETDSEYLTVSKVGVNTFIVALVEDNTISTTLDINGIDWARSISAKYTGPNIHINANYDKTNVEVIVYYASGDNKTLSANEWSVDSQKVINIDENIFYAKFENLQDDFTVIGFKEKEITANYDGPSIELNSDYDKDKVDVILWYTDGNYKQLDVNEWSTDSLTITKIGDNEFIATYEYYDNTVKQTLTDNYFVTGIEKDYIECLEAQYNGPKVYIGTNYEKSKVTVTAVYISGKREIITTDKWKESSLKVEKDVNIYIASYNGLTAKYTVNGYTEKELKAEYTGEPVKVKDNYNKDDVKVTVIYTDNSTKELKSNEWTESALLVEKDGNNEYTATYKTLSTGYTVIGYEDEIKVTALVGTYPEDVLVSKKFKESKADITVTYSNGTSSKLDYKYLDEKPNDRTVTKVGDNTYDIGYKDVKGILTVTGYDIDKIKAKYTGDDIPVGEEYNKDDVIVTVYYSNGTKKVLKSDEWSESGLVVSKNGKNTYTATYKKHKTNYDITGYTKESTVIPTPPTIVHTGVSNNILAIIVCIALSIGCCLLFVYRKRRNK